MQFSRVGEHTVRCIISEEEIENLGYSLDDIMSNNGRTQEFMNHIFDMAEREFAMNFDLGLKTVRADFLPDHTISLTFSEHQSSQMMEHLKDIVNGMLSSFAQEAEAKQQKLEREQKANTTMNPVEEEEDVPEIIAMVTFPSFDVVCRYAKQITMVAIPDSRLYKFKDEYILGMDLTGYTENEVYTLSMLTDEYGNQIDVGREKLALLEEHGDIIINELAIETLQEL